AKKQVTYQRARSRATRPSVTPRPTSAAVRSLLRSLLGCFGGDGGRENGCGSLVQVIVGALGEQVQSRKRQESQTIRAGAGADLRQDVLDAAALQQQLPGQHAEFGLEIVPGVGEALADLLEAPVHRVLPLLRSPPRHIRQDVARGVSLAQ